MKSNTQLYFAYGSNLNIAQMRKRCPGAKPFSPAVLHGWKLVERLYADIEEDGVTFEVPNPNTIIVKGADKQAVGQIAAVIRSKRPPEPYHGKGVKYSDERIRRKAGKAGKSK